ncbi:type II toxin-antitoxin system VapC family toxin [Natrarchaeobaculum aegyptiacum]|uniref:Ribonuclease VapC n=1 Tax=Natrarchaeobaculum aegyptiacum TaxID=745377 RepID=A0A2Z2I1M4_9EURY|nr:type II toxin-antitoxin system VapC family toxin [Natrarchaeobaculum aegyptiacum]ARS90418.1 twitching motility protein PilT [Natrarchaeobaculum aegyptiacum]
MNCLDTSVIVDYLHGIDEVGAYVRAHESEPLFAPTISLQETFVGAVRTRGSEGLERVRADLDWIEPIDLTVDAAAEAAVIDNELHREGTPIGSLDTLIAGTVRAAGGTLVTRDRHFERVDGLEVTHID